MASQSSGTTSQERLVVVDPQLDDYHSLLEPARKQLVRLTLTTTGSNALRLLPSFSDALWLLSLQLPDMNGLDLLEMIHSLRRKQKVVVVDKEYDPECEQQALGLRASQYVCKPVQWSWLKARWSPLVKVVEPSLLYDRPDEMEYLI